jgi:threonine/homoserine/homoserine lactone efflux protein
MLSYLIFGVTYAFAAAVQPGPLNAYLISQTISRGWRHTLPASFSPLISDGPIIILVLFLLSHIPPWFVQFLHFVGAFFLFYLAIGAFRSWQNYKTNQTLKDQSRHQTLLKAVLVNILNPYPYLGWSLVMGPLLLKGYQQDPVIGVALLISFYLTVIACLAGIIFLFAFARNLGPRVSRILIGISVIALVCFGFYQLWLGIKLVFLN